MGQMHMIDVLKIASKFNMGPFYGCICPKKKTKKLVGGLLRYSDFGISSPILPYNAYYGTIMLEIAHNTPFSPLISIFVMQIRSNNALECPCGPLE